MLFRSLHRLVTGLCQMLAPILAYTADEAWELVPGKTVESIHQTKWLPSPFAISETEQTTWKNLFDLRLKALPALEGMRQSKVIGKALEAKFDFAGNAKILADAKQNTEILRELLNVSQLTVNISSTSDLSQQDVKIEKRAAGILTRVILEPESFGMIIVKADGQKCERCWHWESDIGQNAEHPTICGRCVEAVKQSKI